MKRPALVIAAVILLAGGCSAGPIGSGDFSVESHVAELPAGEEPALLSVGDLQAGTQAAGLEPPADGASGEAASWLFELTAGTEAGVFLPAPSVLMQSLGQDGADELGWDLTQVQTFAHHARAPQNTIMVTGDFDADTLPADLEDLGDGVRSAGSGPDQEVSLTEATAVRPTGAPLRLAVADGTIMVDAHEQTVRDWVQGGDRQTFAEDEEVTALAAALDDHDVYAATIATQTGPLQAPGGGGAAQLAELRSEWEQWAVAEPFSVAGAGWAMAEDEPVVLAAYHFGDAESAERGAAQVQRLWEDGRTTRGQELAQMFTVQEVDQDGPVVVLTLHLGEEGLPQHVHHMFGEQEVTFGYLE